jgi:pyruvate dehydrogenase E1 component alpha subunit
MQLAGTLAARCRAFDIPVEEVSGTDLAEALAAAERVVDATRDEGRPHAIISHAMRLGPHSKGDDTRDPAQLQAAWNHDPVATLRDKVGAAADAIDRDIAALMHDALARADEAAG